jgi:endonuclease YncB( thermonuclease family)
VDHQNNDGDNYQIRQPDGRIDEFRLYFVDTPESSLTRSSDGNTNGELIAQQAEYFGGNSSDESIRLGAEAKEFTLSLLKANPFMIFTRHEKVDESGRFYCHLRVDIDGQSSWLDEVLVEKGYARIINQPADLPDGSKAESHRTLLQQLEASAKNRKAGGWK